MAGPAREPLIDRLRDPGKRGALLIGMRDAAGIPTVAVVASMVGFGSLCRAADLSIGFAIATSGGMWALPGQIAYVELAAGGHALIAVLLAVAMANARFLPMTAVLMPYMRQGMTRTGWLYPLSQLVSFNAWIWMVRRFPAMPPAHRLYYYFGFTGVLFPMGMVGTALGYAVAGEVPHGVALGLVYVNIVYFALIFADVRDLAAVASVLAGAIGAPFFHLVASDWGLLITGVVCGSVGFAVSRAWSVKRE